MKTKLIVFLYLFFPIKIIQSQFNYGLNPYNYSPNQNYRPPSSTPTLANQPSPGSNVANIWSSPPKCSPPTATAYYLPTPPASPKVTILNTKQVDHNVKPIIENSGGNIPPPTYPCPFCTGKINIPPNIDIQPPPLSYSVLPGVIDKMPSIIPMVNNIDECKCSCRKKKVLEDIVDTSCLLPNTFNYDKELLEGFLTSLGL